MEPLSAVQRAACADLAAKLAERAQVSSLTAADVRREFLAGVDHMVAVGVPLSVAAAAEDDVEAVAQRIIASDRLARGEGA